MRSGIGAVLGDKVHSSGHGGRLVDRVYPPGTVNTVRLNDRAGIRVTKSTSAPGVRYPGDDDADDIGSVSHPTS